MLDSVEVTDASNSQTVRFLHRDWFSNKLGWRHTLFPEGSDGSTTGLNTYLIRVHTGDVRGAGVLHSPMVPDHEPPLTCIRHVSTDHIKQIA